MTVSFWSNGCFGQFPATFPPQVKKVKWGMLQVAEVRYWLWGGAGQYVFNKGGVQPACKCTQSWAKAARSWGQLNVQQWDNTSPRAISTQTFEHSERLKAPPLALPSKKPHGCWQNLQGTMGQSWLWIPRFQSAQRISSQRRKRKDNLILCFCVQLVSILFVCCEYLVCICL